MGWAQLRQTPASANAVASPLSLANAMAMLQLGAKGRSAAEIAAVFEPTSSGNTLLVERLAEILPELTQPQVGITFVNANRLWLDRSVAKAIEPRYAQAVQSQLQSSADGVDFTQPQAAATSINNWVSQITQGHITQLLKAAQITPSTHMVMTNAVHFKGQWSRPFNPNRTAEAGFTLADGSVVQVPTMHANLRARLSEQQGAILLELPYGNGEFALQIGLPAPGQTLEQLQASLSAAQWAQWSAGLAATELDISLPRFKVDSPAAPLKPVLEKLGVQTLFGSAADLSGITSAQSLMLDQVYQTAQVQVDEQGAEASAATAAVIAAKSLALPTRLDVNRPFLFTIVHNPTQSVLFVGRLANPTL